MDSSLINELNSHVGVDIPQLCDKYFYQNLYYYYQKGGWYPLYLDQLFTIFVWIFKIFFGFIIFYCINWGRLFLCEVDCGELIDYIDIQINGLSMLYLFSSLLYVLYLSYRLYYRIKELKIIDEYVNKYFNDNVDIANISWKNFISKLNLSNKYIVKSVMQYDNFIIGLVNNKCFPTRFFGIPILNSHLENIFKYCVFSHDEFIWQSERKLRNRFRWIAFLYTLLFPIIVPVVLLHAITSNIDMFYLEKDFVGKRNYGLDAIWEFREYNEYYHFLINRLCKSKPYAEKYINSFKYPVYNKIYSLIQIISASFLTLFVLISIIDDNLLTELLFLNKTLIWHIAIWTSIVSFMSSILSRNVNSNCNFEKLLLDWSQYTHYYPNEWYNNANSNNIRNELIRLYPYKIQRIINNLFSYILTPYILYIWSNHAYSILNFIQSHSEEEDIGYICTLSNFDTNLYGSVSYGSLDNGERMSSSVNGKLEKSIITFGIDHQGNDYEKLPVFIKNKINQNGYLTMKPYMEWINQENLKKQLETCLYETYVDETETYMDEPENYIS